MVLNNTQLNDRSKWLNQYNMVKIPAGNFMMGSPEDEEWRSDEEVLHKVTISKPFYLGKFPVTFDQYDSYCDLMGIEKPGDYDMGRGNHPVIDVSWDDAVAYCEWLSKHTGLNFRLPTEAEWEYACRAGTQTPFHYGNSLSSDMANFRGFKPDNASGGMCKDGTTPVGSFMPNDWGFYDMHGNVWEWCHDWYDEQYYSSTPSIDPSGPLSGSHRVFRGGSWVCAAFLCRSAYRERYRPDCQYAYIGFRLACDAIDEQ